MRREALGALAVVGLLVVTGCGGRREAAVAAGGTPVSVRTAIATLRGTPETFEAGGVLHGRSDAAVAARVMAAVVAVDVEPGDRVRAGQTLVRLDDRDLTARLREAEAYEVAASRRLERARADQAAAQAAATLARATTDRIEVLHTRRSATDQELDEARAGVRAADARLEAAGAAVAEATAGVSGAVAGREAAAAGAAYARVVAPFAGIVTEKFVDPGRLVSPGTPLVRVEDTGGFEFDVRVDESRAAWVTPGVAVPVTFDAVSRARDGRVTEVGRAVDSDARAILVTIAVTETEGLRSGMFGRVRFPGPERPSLRVPSAAVTRDGQLTSVFVVDGDRARLRLVRIGRTIDGDTEIVAGLSDGEAVVLDPPATLRDGALVAAAAGARS